MLYKKILQYNNTISKVSKAYDLGEEISGGGFFTMFHIFSRSKFAIDIANTRQGV